MLTILSMRMTRWQIIEFQVDFSGFFFVIQQFEPSWSRTILQASNHDRKFAKKSWLQDFFLLLISGKKKDGLQYLTAPTNVQFQRFISQDFWLCSTKNTNSCFHSGVFVFFLTLVLNSTLPTFTIANESLFWLFWLVICACIQYTKIRMQCKKKKKDLPFVCLQVQISS